jgi:hypothetical protein
VTQLENTSAKSAVPVCDEVHPVAVVAGISARQRGCVAVLCCAFLDFRMGPQLGNHARSLGGELDQSRGRQSKLPHGVQGPGWGACRRSLQYIYLSPKSGKQSIHCSKEDPGQQGQLQQALP